MHQRPVETDPDRLTLVERHAADFADDRTALGADRFEIERHHRVEHQPHRIAAPERGRGRRPREGERQAQALAVAVASTLAVLSSMRASAAHGWCRPDRACLGGRLLRPRAAPGLVSAAPGLVSAALLAGLRLRRAWLRRGSRLVSAASLFRSVDASAFSPRGRRASPVQRRGACPSDAGGGGAACSDFGASTTAVDGASRRAGLRIHLHRRGRSSPRSAVRSRWPGVPARVSLAAGSARRLRCHATRRRAGLASARHRRRGATTPSPSPAAGRRHR